jgi:hypothetical protein
MAKIRPKYKRIPSFWVGLAVGLVFVAFVYAVI